LNSNRREAVLDAGVDASFNRVAKVAHRGADGCGSAAFVAKGTSDVRDVRGGAAGETYVNAKAAGTVVEGGGVRMGGRSRDYSSELSGADGAGGVKGNAGECKELAGGGHDSSCEGSDSARGFVVVLGYP
jgi:hypothetical protein